MEDDDLADAVLTSVNEAILSVENEPSYEVEEQHQPVKKPTNIIPEIDDVEDPEEILLYTLERIDGRYGPLLAYEAMKIK